MDKSLDGNSKKNIDELNRLSKEVDVLTQITTDEFTIIHATLEKISADISGLYLFIQLKHENDKLRADNKELLERLKSQI